jgi:hypothetical protein
MSILSALKQQSGSIDDLAKLPQAMIMQMAQKKQISEDMIAPILSRKAEMTEAVARTKAMQGAGAPQPTIMEQLMQQNAEAEQPPMTDGRDMGVAQLPIPERQYAGGGIVAFAKAGEVEDKELPPRQEGESENAYMQRVQALYGAGNEFFNPRNYNPLAKLGDLYNEYIGGPFERGVNSFIGENRDLEAQAARFNASSNARKNVSLTDTSPNTRTINSTPSQAEIDKIRATNAAPTAPTEPGLKSLTERPAAKPQSPLQKATGAPEMPETKVDPIDAMLAKYEKMIAGDPEASAKARKDAMWSRLAEAGLGIMGGTSTNFAENVGKGATQAMKGYAEDIKGIRADENAKMTQLAGLGLKGAQLKQEARKLGITEKHYDDWLKVQKMQIGESAATRREGAALRADTAEQNRILNAAKMLAARPENMNLTDEQLYAKATQLATGKAAQPTFAGFSGRPLK